MFRNQYDNDVTTWSPQGRIHQIEYAMESTKQGSACVGAKNADFAVTASLNRVTGELSSGQEKAFEIDTHVGISIAGLTSDGRSLMRFMRAECLNHRWAFDAPMPVSRLAAAVGDKMQWCTMENGRRPYGVGFLANGYDDDGPHIYSVDPSANFYDCKAMSIGARSTSARTYLERHVATLPDTDLPVLIKHVLLALRETLPHEVELTTSNVSLCVVGKNTPFAKYTATQVAEHLAGLDAEENTPAPVADDQAMEMAP